MEKEDKEILDLLTKIKDAPLHKGTRLTIEVSEEKGVDHIILHVDKKGGAWSIIKMLQAAMAADTQLADLLVLAMSSKHLLNITVDGSEVNDTTHNNNISN